ncbi:MAG: flagellar filament capping protein FliD [Planctomycetota bacterium]|jgi:flagellar capping protein FliD|nr:flagellar filament capping protein FliD [Planctomycetota bacterium]
MAGPAQQITGLASGFDTASIVEQLMAVEKTGYTKLETKQKTEQLKLQAYQGVNTFIKKFKESVANLAGQKLWNSKSASSTNDSSLTATASQYAVNGSYSFRVTQMAGSAQFSSKGFNSKTEALGASQSNGAPNQLGVVTMNNAQARVDQSAKLESFNGGGGVFRGSIRITDSRGNSAVVDLSGTETINDVVDSINNATGVLVKASVGRGADGSSYLVIDDESEGSGKLKIQNVGQGTTATDLGIAGAAETAGGPINGRNLFYLGRDTDLSLLNDGLGVEQGRILVDIEDANGGGLYFQADLSSARTVGDALDAVNAAIAKAKQDSVGTQYEGYLDDLNFQLNAGRNGFEFVGAKEGHTYDIGDVTVSGAQSNPETSRQLGLFGSHYVATGGGGSIGGTRVLGDIDSPMLKNIAGAYGGGIGSAGGDTPQVPTSLTGSTLLSQLNGGKGIDIGSGNEGLSIAFFEGGGANHFETKNIVDYAGLRELTADPTATVDDLLLALNDGLAAYQGANHVNGFDGLQFNLDGDGIVLSGMSEAHQYVIQNTTLAQSLGLVRDKMGGNSAYVAELGDLYKVEEMVGGTTQINEGETTLAELTKVGGGAVNTSGWGAAGQFIVTVGGTTVDISSALSGLTNGSTVAAYLTAVNDKLKAEFGDYSPQLLVDIAGKGFQWRNVDLTEDFSASGTVVDEFGLDNHWTGRSDVDIGEAKFESQSLNPTATGYSRPVALTASNYDQVKLGQLYNGRGLAFTGDDADTFEIKFLEDTVDEYGFSISKAELTTALEAKAAGGKLSNLSVKDYLDAFNQVIADKISSDPALAGMVVEVGIKDGAFAITKAVGLTNNDLMSFTGELAKNTTAGWGFGSIQVASGTGFPSGGTISGDNLDAIEYVEQDIQGLGELTIKVGNAEYTLSTAGLGGENSLRDLIGKLNEELSAKLQADGVTADIKFAMNNSGTGLAVDNNSGLAVTFVDKGGADSLVRDLGFVDPNTGEAKRIESYSFGSAKTLAKQYVSRASDLSALGVEAGVLVVTNARGQTANIDVSEAKTIGDIVDALNSITNFGVRARINEAGDGITVEEYYEPGNEPNPPPDGRIVIADQSGSNTAKQLGILGEGSDGAGDAKSVISGSMKKEITVWSNDTLTTLMNRISSEGYKTAIVNDGSVNPFRLTIASSTTGAASDFILDSDVELLGLTQTSRGKDAKILYGDPNSGVSPMFLSSATNSNSTAILGLTLDIKSVSDAYTTITVDTDKSKVTDEIKAMVASYNELNDFVAYLDGYDPETNEPGVLFGDTSVRNLMKSIDDMFYLIFNPEGVSYNEITDEAKKTWSWMDLGISFQATESTDSSGGTTSSSWYSSMVLDEEALSEMVSANWEQLYNALASQTNVTDSSRGKNVAASASFNYQYDRDQNGNIIYPEGGWNVNNAINGDSTSSIANGVNGFQANKTIAQGENQYTVWLQQPATLSRLSIYHAGSVTVDGETGSGALRDFKVEYMDANTGKWETLREVEGNTGSASHLGFALPTTVSALRVTASATNAEDGKFRLLDIQAIEDTGLAGKLNQLTGALADVTTGFMAERQTEVEDKLQELDDQMVRMQEKLDAKEALLWRQFTAMESALSQLQNQGNQITSMLSSMGS